MMTFKQQISDMTPRACQPAIDWVGDRTAREAWEQCERPDWLIGMAHHVLDIPTDKIVECGIMCAAQVPQSLAWLLWARNWITGEDRSHEAAADAAAAAAWAAEAHEAAAAAAAEAATWATWADDAAWAAADAAWAAAEAAADAARAACAAARAADAGGDSIRMCNLIREIVKPDWEADR